MSTTPPKKIVATTFTNLQKEPTFHSELLLQMTNGHALDVLKTEGEWSYARQSDGYEGWAYSLYLAEPVAGHSPTHFVSDLALTLHASTDAATTALTRLPIGSAVNVSEQRGDWSRVELVRNAISSGWAKTDGLRSIASLPLAPDKARQQIVADARRLTGVYYIWGGNSAWGIDCSGLAQLTHKLAGYTLLRDARLQYPVGKPVEPPFAPGDLLFFHGEVNKDRITHVGISTGGWKMIHSSRGRNGVYEEDLESAECAKTRERFVGARTFL